MSLNMKSIEKPLKLSSVAEGYSVSQVVSAPGTPRGTFYGIR